MSSLRGFLFIGDLSEMFNALKCFAKGSYLEGRGSQYALSSHSAKPAKSGHV